MPKLDHDYLVYFIANASQILERELFLIRMNSNRSCSFDNSSE